MAIMSIDSSFGLGWIIVACAKHDHGFITSITPDDDAPSQGLKWILYLAHKSMRLTFPVVAALYYCAAISLAITLPCENRSTVAWRVTAVIASVLIIPYRDTVSTALVGSSLGSHWLVFIALTLIFVIVFGLLYTVEQRQILFGCLI